MSFLVIEHDDDPLTDDGDCRNCGHPAESHDPDDPGLGMCGDCADSDGDCEGVFVKPVPKSNQVAD